MTRGTKGAVVNGAGLKKQITQNVSEGNMWLAISRTKTASYVFIVNKSLTTSYNCRPEYTTKPNRVDYISPITCETKPYSTPQYYVLAPGQGVLLRVEFEK